MTLEDVLAALLEGFPVPVADKATGRRGVILHTDGPHVLVAWSDGERSWVTPDDLERG